MSEEATKVSHVEKTAGGLRFEMIDRFLPLPFPVDPRGVQTPVACSAAAWRSRTSLPGTTSSRSTATTVATADSADWKEGVILESGPEFDQAQALRAAINRKNDLFFYRWRPQNITYLLGFRKHEQGNNAVEIPQFDPLVAEQEKSIARLKKPVPHLYELSRVEKEVAR